MRRGPSRTERGRWSRGTGRSSCGGQAARAPRPASPRLSGDAGRSGERWREAIPTSSSSPAGARSRRRRRSRGAAPTGVPYVPARRESRPRPAPALAARASRETVVPRVVRKAAGVLALGTASRESVVARGAEPGTRARSSRTRSTSTRGGERAGGCATTRRAARDSSASAPRTTSSFSPWRDWLRRRASHARSARRRRPATRGLPRRRRRQRARLGTSSSSSRTSLGVSLDAATVTCPRKRSSRRTSAPTSSRSSHARALGGGRQRGGRVRPAARPLRPRRRCARPAPRRENGVLVPADDVDCCRAALERLAADPGAAPRMGARSRELAAGLATSRRSRTSSPPCARRRRPVELLLPRR